MQAYLVRPREIVPLLDAVGPWGVYILGLFRNEAEVESVTKEIETYR